ncbi:class I SAM-dependent methyltransferase [Leptospira kanakyensis]|uniref:Class I SAM-dependent methyltransferase n=1 Tax=Leptospira kanakyensis TaxID=2484968 RepID=A0A6N4QIG7_9LEPT|nr:class I SAM-dependent methyltransferase [Leptospira kanakyensis]TGK51928.1 class I SAM-dependent methyltransferase [Leptospira kanakyensis]TGK57164.1 class I SAM-dependent methyltransferase [Leptospira kanakyensis]TGK71820.1 class I SAM-dependent methyltransferase [Leptospira kanakyensis]
MSNKISEITACRISGSKNLISVLNLGNQTLTGVFPKSKDEVITSGPLELVLSPESGLLQLRHSYDLDEMYGMNYGYRSGLNQSMVKHLQQKIDFLVRLNPLSSGDIVLDIGSNDATTLKSYKTLGIKRIGIDPTGKKFSEYYTDGIELVPDFFTKDNFRKIFPKQNAKIITSIAMFYDLESPKKFVSDIYDVLAPDGIWHFEQSYMPTMLRMNAYDTVCHEHLEYYSLSVVKKLLNECGLKVIDVQMNSVNGGSFAVTAAKKESQLKSNDAVINWMLDQEDRMGLHTPSPYRKFEERVFQHKENLTSLIKALVSDGKKVFGYGASTKGNVLLQFCQFTEKDIPYIAEVNPNKFGSYTPGTLIPIVSESEAKAMKPDYMLVLPWHFRDSIIAREQEYLASGGKLIFPLPEIEIV